MPVQYRGPGGGRTKSFGDLNPPRQPQPYTGALSQPTIAGGGRPQQQQQPQQNSTSAMVGDTLGQLGGFQGQIAPPAPAQGLAGLMEQFQGMFGGGQQQQQPQMMNITTGIQPPQIPQAPQAQAPPQFTGSPMQQQAAIANFGQAAQPQLATQLAQYYPQASGLQDAGQLAQAQSGLGWGGLGQQSNQIAQSNQVAQQGQLLQLLQQATGGLA